MESRQYNRAPWHDWDVCITGGGPIDCDLYFASAVIVLFIIFCVWAVYALRKEAKEDKIIEQVNRQARQTKAVTDVPVIPEWLKTDERLHRTEGFPEIKWECRWEAGQNPAKPYNPRITESAHRWIQGLIDKKFGKNKVKLPHFACAVSIPSTGFMCGSGKYTDFLPESGAMEPGAYLLYRMCGDDRIQITYLITSDATQVAGYCVYMYSPMTHEIHYWPRHVEFDHRDSAGFGYQRIVDV